MSYIADQLMAPYFSRGRTKNGAPGGDRWARVLGGQIGWLSDPFRRVHVGCSEIRSTNEFEIANSWKARTKISPHPKHTTKITAAQRPRLTRDGARRNTFHVGPHSPVSIDPGFVKIGLVQLSQSVKTTNVTHTLTGTQTDRRTNRQKDRQTN